MANVGYATLTVIPSMKGMGARLTQEWAAVGTGAAAKAGTAQGKAYGDSMSKAAQGIAQGTTSKVSALLGTALKGGTVALAAAGAYGFYKASQAASEFETRISAVGAVSGASGAELDTLRQKSLQLGADTAFSASESASAIEELVKAGLTVPEVMNGAADATVALAAAGEIDLTQAATIASNALNAFKLSAQDLPGIADTIAGAANVSAIDVEELGMSMQQVAAVANLVGLSMEDTTTAIGLLGDAGIRGSDAGTSLKTMLQRLTPQTDEQARAMEELGLLTEEGTSRFFDQSGQVKSLAEVADILSGALSGMGEEQKIATLQTLFGTDAIRAAAIVAGEGAAGVNEFAGAVAGIDAEDVAAQRLDNLAGDFEQLGGSIETLLIKGGTPFNTWLRELVQAGTAATNWLADPPEGFTDWLQSTGDTIASAVLPIWEDLVDTGRNLWDLASGLASDLRPLAEGFATIAGTALVATLQGLAQALSSVSGFLADNQTTVLTVAAAWGTFRAVMIGEAIWAAASAGIALASRSLDSMAVSAYNAAGAVTALNVAATGGFLAAGALFAALVTGHNRATRAAEEWRSEVENDIDPRSLASYQSAIDEATVMMGQAQEELGGLGSGGLWDGIKTGLRGTIEMLTPMENSVYDAATALGVGEDAFQDFGEAAAVLQRVYRDVGDAVGGMGLEQVEAWVQRLDLDPTTMQVGEMADAISNAKRMAEDGSPATDRLAEAFGTLGDETSSATDQLQAWSDAVDAVLGVELGIVESTSAFEESIDGLTESLMANGGTLDLNTEAGRANADAMTTAARDAIAMAEAYGQTGQIEEATFVLAASRDRIIEAGIAAGRSREEMEAFADQIGLTPENATVTVGAEGVEPTEAALNWTSRDRPASVIAGAVGTNAVDSVLGVLARPRVAQYFGDARTAEAELYLNSTARDRLAIFAGVAQTAEAERDLAWLARARQVQIQAVISERYAGQTAAYEAGRGDPFYGQGRWGAITEYAKGGITPAHITRDQLFKYGEPETGGEAFIPRLGNKERSLAILAEAASWYGMGVTPMARGGVVDSGASRWGRPSTTSTPHRKHASSRLTLEVPVGAIEIDLDGQKVGSNRKVVRAVTKTVDGQRTART